MYKEVNIISETTPLDSNTVLSPANHNGRLRTSENPDDRTDFADAVRFGADWLEAANGRTITRREYELLHDAGYVACSYDELFGPGFFENWDDYLVHAQQEYDDRPDREFKRKQQLLSEARHEQRTGQLPDVLFQATAKMDEKNKKDSNRRLKREYLVDGEAGDEVIIERFLKYKLLDEVAREFPSTRHKLDQARRIRMVMGFDFKTKVVLPGFLSEVKALAELSKHSGNGGKRGYESLIDDDFLDKTIQELGAQDYIPAKRNYRKIHMDELLTIAGWSKNKRQISLAARFGKDSEAETDQDPTASETSIGSIAMAGAMQN